MNHPLGTCIIKPRENTYFITSIAWTKVGDYIWTPKGWRRVKHRSYVRKKYFLKFLTPRCVLYATKNQMVFAESQKKLVKDTKILDFCYPPMEALESWIRLKDRREDMIALGVICGLSEHNPLFFNKYGEVGVKITKSKYNELEESGILKSLPIKVWERKVDNKITLKVKASYKKFGYQGKRVLPAGLRFGEITKILSFLKGLLSVKGKINTKNEIVINFDCKGLSLHVLNILATLGIKCEYIPYDLYYKNVVYLNEDRFYKIVINDNLSKKLYLTMIGFIDEDLTQNKLKELEEVKICLPQIEQVPIIDVKFEGIHNSYIIETDDPTSCYVCDSIWCATT